MFQQVLNRFTPQLNNSASQKAFITKSSLHRQWLFTFVELASRHNIFEQKFAAAIATAPAFQHLLSRCIEYSPASLNSSNIQIALCFELTQPEFSIVIEKHPECWRLKNFSSSLINKLSKHLAAKTLANCLPYPSPPSDQEKAINHHKSTQVLCHDANLARAYFSQYHHPAGTVKLTVWRYAQHRWQTLIKLTIHSKAQITLENGLWRQAYRYSIGTEQQAQWIEYPFDPSRTGSRAFNRCAKENQTSLQMFSADNDEANEHLKNL